MPVTRTEYMDRFLDAVDRVESGRPGSISDDRWLCTHYSAEFAEPVSRYLGSPDERVRAETVLLLANVRERAPMKRVAEMRKSDCERVRMACIGYLNLIRDDDSLIEELFEILDHRSGEEFSKAAARMASVAREKDIDHLREVYGLVKGDMRADIAVVLDAVIRRNPSLKDRRELIMSVPVYPDEDAFERFLDNTRDYLETRYGASIRPKASISLTAYNNVSSALRKIRIRLYNEADNLQFYGPDKADRLMETAEMVKSVSKDLSGKTVVGADQSPSRICPRCGELMVVFKGTWVCRDCGRS